MSACCGVDAIVFGHTRDCRTQPPVTTAPRPAPPEAADMVNRPGTAYRDGIISAWHRRREAHNYVARLVR